MVRLVEDMRDPDHPATPVLVLANSVDAGGLVRAREYGIATEVVDHRPFKGDRQAFENNLKSVIEPYRVDILCLAGFMRVLTQGFVSDWTGRMLNIHPSLLPKYQGLHTHQRAIDAGDALAGCSVHEVVPQLDAGPVLGQSE